MNAVNENIYINLASHAIGLDHKKPYKRHKKYFYRPYRNYFTLQARRTAKCGK